MIANTVFVSRQCLSSYRTFTEVCQNYYIQKRRSIYIYIYYWHKVKHIPFVNITKVLGTLRTKTFERCQNLIVVTTKAEYQPFDKENQWNL